ncbi:DUF262 domain-containing protein [Candidatus Saccharibacteria bacterium]|nr:DUF262 domain-containing protein [Candidatus Saccharibacteria bacterium]
MSDTIDQDESIALANLLEKDLVIPSYQRAYEWDKKNVYTLLDDIYKYYAKRKNTNLGAIILYKNKDGVFEIVDGQQRLITLSLLLKVLNQNYENRLLDNPILCIADTEARIVKNYYAIKEFIDMLAKSDNWNEAAFYDYLTNNIRFYILESKSQDEAFQLFDGRNSKYKDLTPVDLLKAYHLGALDDNFFEKREILQSWDKNINASFSIDDSCNKIEYLYNNVLFNIYNWSLNKEAKPFTKDDVYLYKGFKEEDRYAYVEYCRGNTAHQINKPFKSGKDFFTMTDEYIKTFDALIKKYNLKDKLAQESEIADGFDHRFRCINYLYYCALFAFFDRFGSKVKPFYADMIESFIFEYSLALRVKRAVVSLNSLNKYILESNETRYNFFFECNNALGVEELLKLEVDSIGDRPANDEKVGEIRGKLWDYLTERSAAL